MLIAKNISYEGSNGPLFEDVTISLDGAAKKRIAIVGKNGCGKSTLLKLLNGELEPGTGSVSRSNELVVRMQQDVSFPNGEMLVGEYLESKLKESWMTYKIEMVLQELGMSREILLLELKVLSGGQRMRIALAELLLAEPTVLLLDEPTNHLDRESIEWLKNFVQEFTGTVAFVSHDRNFISATANQIWEITANREIEVYSCNNDAPEWRINGLGRPCMGTASSLGLTSLWLGLYDKFLLERYERYEKKLALYEFSQREVTELTDWLRANANHPKYKFSATVAQKKKALERMEKKAPPEPVADPRVNMRHLGSAQEGTVLDVKIESKNYEGRKVLGKLSFKILTGERVLIRGPNGSGKTTLLNILSGDDKDYVGQITARNNIKIGYLHQFSALNPENTVLDEFGLNTAMEYTQGRGTLASYLFPADLVDVKIKHLSYGQQRRLELAILLANKPDLLLLDEPTNHLDIFLREDLERFLLEQERAMCIISHDQYFIDKVGITHVVDLG